MTESKILIKIIDIIYVLGVLIVIYHLGLALFAGNVIPNPDAMLPYTYLEIVPFRLALGAIPMTLASIFLWRGNCMGQSIHKRRNFVLTFLPAAVCLLCMMFYIAFAIFYVIYTFFWFGTGTI